MKDRYLWIIWGVLFSICAGVGFIQDATGAGKFFQVLLSVLFFVPGGLLLWNGIRKQEKKTVRLIRYVSLSSLALTLLLIIINFLTVGASEAAGNAWFYILTVVSTPMLCSSNWAWSLFLWACLLVGSFYREKPAKSN